MAMKFFILVCFVGLTVASGLSQQLMPFQLEDYLEEGEIADFIVGGRLSVDGESPYQVAVTNMFRNVFCGGSIISARWILTAAHCVCGIFPAELDVRYNSLTRSSGGQLVRVSNIMVHQNYNHSNNDNDIALLKTSTALILNRTNAAAISLPPQGSNVTAGTVVEISGWGKLHNNSIQLAENLQIVNLTVVEHSKCKKVFHTLTLNTFCAYGDGKSTCQGDSGGPVVQNKQLVGIVAFGSKRGCTLPDTPGAYTRVGSYINWINSTINGPLPDPIFPSLDCS